MTVCWIWDISPLLFFINFEITLAVARVDFKIDRDNQVTEQAGKYSLLPWSAGAQLPF